MFEIDNAVRPEEKTNQYAEYIDQQEHAASYSLKDTVQTLQTMQTVHTAHSLSIVLPVYNEEAVIASIVEEVLEVVNEWCKDFEIILVNDGSTDRSGYILAALSEATPRIRVITHEHNQGYGASLADGFAAATKELTFFMDSDGQFAADDLPQLLAFIDDYDAVIGYRIYRQDTWLRKLNAWGWKKLIGGVLDIQVRDIDCAFKLWRTEFLHQYAPETRGAMINAELLYKLTRAGYSYREVGVRHLPREAGKATGAKPQVIVRAFRELFVYARKWQHENIAIASHARISK